MYYLTRGFNASTCAFNLPTRTFHLTTRAFSLLTCRFELLTRGFELAAVTRLLPFHWFGSFCWLFETLNTRFVKFCK